MTNDDLTPDCGRFRSELSAYLYAELALDTRTTLEEHLAGCMACRDELAALQDTQRLLARWETPPAGEDPRALARAIAQQARGEAAPPAPRAVRGRRLVRWSAVLSGAAAALLFSVSVLGTHVSVHGGRFELSFALPGAHAQPAAPSAGNDWQEEVRAIAAQEVANHALDLQQNQEEYLARFSQMTREEFLRLSQAVDYARAQDLRSLDTRFASLGQEAASADLETRRQLAQLYQMVSYRPDQPNR
jgi:anti-sigma factor RsiW